MSVSHFFWSFFRLKPTTEDSTPFRSDMKSLEFTASSKSGPIFKGNKLKKLLKAVKINHPYFAGGLDAACMILESNTAGKFRKEMEEAIDKSNSLLVGLDENFTLSMHENRKPTKNWEEGYPELKEQTASIRSALAQQKMPRTRKPLSRRWRKSRSRKAPWLALILLFASTLQK